MAAEEKYLILSDIHGNVSAFEAVLQDCQNESFSGIVLLGDCIDYGMRSNEIIMRLSELENGIWRNRILSNIWGNHEKLVIDKDLERLSSDRGRVMAAYTIRQLTDDSISYISSSMNRAGKQEFQAGGLKFLAVHGSLEDHFWKAIAPDDLCGDYGKYDVILSGHSHYSHCFTHFYPACDPVRRNKKAVLFLNPGSVGQPRNHNPYAQYAVLSLPSKRVELRAVAYDIACEQSFYPKEIDEFYKTRLTYGV